eukprot:2232727-Karenia_brevis.AAC.1
MADLHAQLEGRILLIMRSTLGGHFPTIPSFVLEAAVVILVHKHNAGERYGFWACEFQTGKSGSWEEKETEEEPVQR